MDAFRGNSEFHHEQEAVTGVLLTNLGTPDAPTPSAIRRYLAEFLSDPRVVEAPRWLWWLILHGIILRLRPRRVTHAYQSIWTEDGSPLLQISRQQADALQQHLTPHFKGKVQVALAMRYGQPSIAEGLRQLHEAGAQRLMVLPLYPQYSATTTASTFDAVAKELMQWRWLPTLRMITQYHDHPAYIQALAKSIEEFWQEHERPEKLMFSFHGLPKRYLLAGDPYFCQCQKTARLVAETLQLDEQNWCVSFQSRVGKEEWLKPYTDKTLEQLGQQKLRSVHVICPGFSADCLETLEEINMQNRALFLDAGGQQFEYIPALNALPAHIDLLAQLIEEHAGNWLELKEEDAALRLQQAKKLGARN